LIEPVEFAGIEYTELTFRKLKVKHLLEINTNGLNQLEAASAIAAASAGVDPGVIHELALEDFMEINKVIENFIPSALVASASKASE
jgi:hypothetical protein